MDTVKCEQCGTEMARSTRFCPECGHANPAVSATTEIPRTVVPWETASASDNPPADAASSGFLTPEMSAAKPTGGPEPIAQSAPSQQTRYFPPTQTAYAPPPTPHYAQTQNLGQPGSAQLPALPSYSQNPVGYQYQSQVGVAGVAPKDSTVALLLELIGYVGFLGIGHIYANRVTRGILLMLGWWGYGVIVAVLFFTIVLSPVACLMAIAWPVVPILSGLWIKTELDRENAASRGRY